MRSDSRVRQVQSLLTDGLRNATMVFCALTDRQKPAAYVNSWREAWTQTNQSHQRAFEQLNGSAGLISTIAASNPRMQSDLQQALADLALLTSSILALTPMIPEPQTPIATADSLKAMSDEELRKALDIAANLSIAHAAVLMEYMFRADLYSRVLQGLPQLSKDLRGIEVVPGITLSLGSVNVIKARLAFARRYLEANGLLPSSPKAQMPRKWTGPLDKDYAEVNHEALFLAVGK